MIGSTVLWAGPRAPGPDELRTLDAAGLCVTTVTSVPPGGPGVPPDVLVLAGVTLAGIAGTASETSATWLLALTEAEADVPAALAAGAHDALPGSAPAAAVCERVLVGARAANRLRTLAARTVSLELQVQTLRQRIDGLESLAFRDDLTGLENRRGFSAALDRALEFARRYGGPVAVLVADLDGMKRLNDTCGHPAGDEALRRIGAAFRSTLRACDVAARIGGDEFAVVLPATGAAAAVVVADRIRQRIEALLLPEGRHMSASFGVAAVASPRGVGFAGEELFARADAALYEAKRDGRNRVRLDAAAAQAVA